MAISESREALAVDNPGIEEAPAVVPSEDRMQEELIRLAQDLGEKQAEQGG